MPGSSEYQCGECRHLFRLPEGGMRDTRLLMCPACGSIDLNLMDVERAPKSVWKSREVTPATKKERGRTSFTA